MLIRTGTGRFGTCRWQNRSGLLKQPSATPGQLHVDSKISQLAQPGRRHPRGRATDRRS